MKQNRRPKAAAIGAIENTATAGTNDDPPRRQPTLMTKESNAALKSVAPTVGDKSKAGSSSAPPRTLEERVQRIETLGQRIDGYIRFMCAVGSLTGTSAEAKERAVTAFYEQMLVVERQLARIQEALRLE